jgi:hypothetical protein
MTELLRQVYAALLPLPVQMTRAWPQMVVPLPSIALSEADNSQRADGGTVAAVQIDLRAAAPEEADALARQVNQALMPLGLRRTRCQDAFERDSGTCLKRLLYERREEAADTAPGLCILVLQGQPVEGRVLWWRRQRRLQEHTALVDDLPRLSLGPLVRDALRICFGAGALPGLTAAFEAGQQLELTVDGLPLQGLPAALDLLEGRPQLELAVVASPPAP